MTKANECTCPSGDGSLRHPCPAHPASVELAGVATNLTFINGRPAMCGCQVEYSSGGGEYSDVIYVTLCAKHSGSAILDLVATNRIALTPEYEGQWHADLYLDREIPLAKAEGATPAEAVLALMSAERIDPEQESVGQAGGDEREAKPGLFCRDCGGRLAVRGVCSIYCPKCEKGDGGSDSSGVPAEAAPPESVALLYRRSDGNDRAWSVTCDPHYMEFFRKADGYESKLLVDATLAQPSPAPELAERGTQHRFSTTEQTCRHDFAGVWWNDNGETKTGRECRHCGFFVADVIKAQAEQAEAERPEGTADLLAIVREAVAGAYNEWKMTSEAVTEIMEAHERIVGALRFERQQMDRAFTACINERDAANARLHEVATACATAEQERDAALARVAELEAKLAELERQEPVSTEHLPMHIAYARAKREVSLGSCQEDVFRFALIDLLQESPLYAAPVAQAQRSVPEEFIGRLSEFLAQRGATGKALLRELRDMLAAAPGNSVPQAWLDVQAERRRQVEVEGYHGFRDSHYINYELSKAARAYIEVSWHALSGGLPCKKPESWPWMTGFKWADGRTMLVKACALGLAEIERLDRAASAGKEVGHE